jgi:hypothetical protein
LGLATEERQQAGHAIPSELDVPLTPSQLCTSLQAMIAGANQTPVPYGLDLFGCSLAISPSASKDGTYPLTCLNATATNFHNEPVPITCTSGAVITGEE